MLSGTRPSTRTISSKCGRMADICPSLWKRTYLGPRLCTSFTILGGPNSIIARTFFGLTSMPLWDNMNPKNFPAVTPNTHLLGFSFMLYDRRVSNVSWRSPKWLSLRKLVRSTQFGAWTFCSLIFGTSLLRSWVQTASLCSKNVLGWWQRKFFPDPPHSFWYDYNLKRRPWSLGASV